MEMDKFKAAEKTMKKFETLFGKSFKKVVSVANQQILSKLTDGMNAGIPQMTTFGKKKLWVVPIQLSKKTGVFGEVGAILINPKDFSILGMSEENEIYQKAEILLNEKAQAA